MKRWFTFPFLAPVAVSICLGQVSPSAGPLAQGGTAPSNQAHRVLAVELLRSLDSRKLRVGDEVDAEILTDFRTSNGITINRGSKMIGHIAEAKARANGNTQSVLGIVFDKIRPQGRADMAINATVVAVAPDPNLANGDAGGHVDYTDRTAIVYHSSVPSQPGEPVPLLTEESRGVLGIRNLQLRSDGVLTSSDKELKLDLGTQMLLAVGP